MTPTPRIRTGANPFALKLGLYILTPVFLYIALFFGHMEQVPFTEEAKTDTVRSFGDSFTN